MKWVLTKDRLPEEGEQRIFDGDELGVMYASVKMNGKHPCLLVYDSSGEEFYEDIEPYYRWLDESVEVVTKEHFDNMEYALTEGAEEWRSKYFDEMKTSESLRKALADHFKKGKSPYNY